MKIPLKRAAKAAVRNLSPTAHQSARAAEPDRVHGRIRCAKAVETDTAAFGGAHRTQSVTETSQPAPLNLRLNEVSVTRPGLITRLPENLQK